MWNMKSNAVLRFLCIFMTAFSVVIMTDIKWTKFNHPNETIFQTNGIYGMHVCGRLCYITAKCVRFSYNPDNNQCIGCLSNKAQWFKRHDLMPGSMYFGNQECPAGRIVVKRERTCYIGGPNDLTFQEAVTHCEEIGAHVVQAETLEENTFLKNFFNITTAGADKLIWHGLTDIVIEGTWQWYNPHGNSSFTDWGDGELKNTKPMKENCAVFHQKHDWKWADITCAHPEVTTFCEKRIGK